MAWQSGAVRGLRGFQSLDVLLRVLMLHVARGCSCGRRLYAPGSRTGAIILADAGYCSAAEIEYIWRHSADVLVRVNPQSFVA
jgi:hypothetical protein